MFLLSSSLDSFFVIMKDGWKIYILLTICIKMLIAVSTTKPLASFDLNELPPAEESESHSNGESRLDMATKSSEKQHGTKRRAQSYSFKPLAKEMKRTRNREAKPHKKPTSEQLKQYSEQKKKQYAELTADEKKERIQRVRTATKDRLAKMNSEELKNYKARKKTLESARRLKLKLERTEEEEKAYKARRAFQNRNYYLKHLGKDKKRKTS